VEVVVANRVLDLVAEGVHLAIRAATLRDSSLVARRFMTVSGGLWASPAYLARREAPRTPADLVRHEFIRFPRFGARELQLTDGRSRVDLPAHGRIAVDDLETVRNLALQGGGIAMLTDYLARDAKLVRVLPRWTWMGGALSFVYPGQRFVPANVRAFIDTALEARG
jgi:DNA-binding transcriptional LysR family regulator